MKARILKRLTDSGKTLEVGDIVDVSNWRNTKTLISGRYLEITHEQAEEKKPSTAKSASVESKVPAKIKDSKSE